jgi:YfiH family protein
MHPDWIVPDWPAPRNVGAFITTRAGGVSEGPYASLNLGLSTGEDESAVRANRAIVRDALPDDPRWLHQIHGARVLPAAQVSDRPQADASYTGEPRIVCAIQIADCMPVLLTDTAGSVVAAAHAGWRGLASGVLENTIAKMVQTGARAPDLLAYLGPAIGPDAFEVGDDVYEAFTQVSRDASAAFKRKADGKWLCDLFMLARASLERSGVTRIYGGGLCTYSDPQRFYSYRRDKTTGRMAAFIWLGTAKRAQ